MPTDMKLSCFATAPGKSSWKSPMAHSPQVRCV
jgi:hypothetical protein